MSENNLKFYQIFRFGNTIGVNQMNFGDIIIANFMTLVVMVILIGLFVTMIPFLILLIYAFTVMLGSWEQINQERIGMNVLSIAACTYFIFDYHYGFLGWRVLHTFTSTESVNKFFYLIIALLLFNIFLIFMGNKIFSQINSSFGRLLMFAAFCFFGYKILYPISAFIAPSLVSQYYEKEKVVKENDYETYVEPPYQDIEEEYTEEEEY